MIAVNKSDMERDYYMLKGPLAKKGYDWWWHSLTAYNKKTKEPKAFFIEYFVCNPALAEDKPTLGQNPENKKCENHKLMPITICNNHHIPCSKCSKDSTQCEYYQICSNCNYLLCSDCE